MFPVGVFSLIVIVPLERDDDQFDEPQPKTAPVIHRCSLRVLFKCVPLYVGYLRSSISYLDMRRPITTMDSNRNLRRVGVIMNDPFSASSMSACLNDSVALTVTSSGHSTRTVASGYSDSRVETISWSADLRATSFFDRVLQEHVRYRSFLLRCLQQSITPYL